MAIATFVNDLLVAKKCFTHSTVPRKTEMHRRIKRSESLSQQWSNCSKVLQLRTITKIFYRNFYLKHSGMRKRKAACETTALSIINLPVQAALSPTWEAAWLQDFCRRLFRISFSFDTRSRKRWRSKTLDAASNPPSALPMKPAVKTSWPVKWRKARLDQVRSVPQWRARKTTFCCPFKNDVQ